MLDLIKNGFIFGILIAAPVGPIGVLCIRRTLNDGRLAGFLSGLGAATADSSYALLAVFGLGALSDQLISWQLALRSIGGIFLVYLGIRIFLARPSNFAGNVSSKNYLASYLGTFFLTITNPITILSFTAAFVGLGFGTNLQGISQGIWLVLGVFSGSAVWWFFLSLVTGLARGRLNQTHLSWVNRISGSLIIVFGVVILSSLGAENQGQISSVLENNSSRASIPGIAEGFTQAFPGYKFNFPVDYGPHEDFQTEWWYITGNLKASDNRSYGYQLTVFRRSLLPPQYRIDRSSTWETDQIYLGHFAVTDAVGKKHYAFERLERGAVEIAGSVADPFSVWVANWHLTQVGPDDFRLHAGTQLEDGEIIQIDLELASVKSLVLHGDLGYSQKGTGIGNASFYYSLPRLETSGKIKIGDDEYTVTGTSWMDHEFSTGALSQDQVGWDWFSIQLDDHTELMVFQIRKADGSIDLNSSGTWVMPDGESTHLENEDFSIEILDHWISESSGGVYPSRWKIRIEKLDLTLDLVPLVDDQEIDLAYTYWEGAVRISGVREGSQVEGYGYVEMTGYAGTMAGEF